ncbi:patatin-like phospholipase family protein [Nibrella saemangeumensis]|uniref:Patatin-like phospholipase family protein n=1 Tax=Nibrella saemangeumensis TaxID=1084526 RepID=A0ABP8NDC3_9BACT
MELPGGETLFHQGEAGDSLYFVISGRLRAFLNTEAGPVNIGEIKRGESVGEMAIFTGEPRMATIIAVRDTVLIKLTKAAFEELVLAYPNVLMGVTRVVINRLNKMQKPPALLKKPVTICFIPITPTVDLPALVATLHPYLNRKVKSLVLSSQSVDQVHGHKNLSQTDHTHTEEYRKLTGWLEEQELQHEFLIYLADPAPTEWTKRSLRHADDVILVADALQPPALSTLEKDLPQLSDPGTGATQILLLLHKAGTICPAGTDQWLGPRSVKAHYHIRPELPKDVARLARILSGSAVGLVLAGGGAKGFAHLGVYQALQEYGIPVDFVGGASAGALMGAYISFDLPPETIRNFARKSAKAKPATDYNLLPLISLIKGKRFNRVIKESIDDCVGFNVRMEDVWRTFFTVAGNYTRAYEEVHMQGFMADCLNATIAIPGVFPPVIRGNDLLIDGGTFNNFPTDVMSRMGAGKVIGVDLSRDKVFALDITEMPDNWALLLDKFRPRKKRKYHLPSLSSILLNTTLMHSTARYQENKQFTDLYFNPDVSRFGLMRWDAFDTIYEIGYTHAKEVLSKLTEAEVEQWRS